ncbi:hypothetical protein D9M71_734160 [compost metagenome]
MQITTRNADSRKRHDCSPRPCRQDRNFDRQRAPAVCLGRLRTEFRPADFRLHVATSAQCNLSAAQIRVDPERRPTRSAERNRRSDGGPVRRTLINNGRPLGEGPQLGADGRALEPGYTELRPCAKLPAHVPRQVVGWYRRGSLWQRRCRCGAFGFP